MIDRHFATLACVTIVGAGAADAQSTQRWSLDVVGGNGRHPAQVGTEYFFPGERPTARFVVSRRMNALHSRAFYVLAQYEGVPQLITSETLSCAITPTGAGCVHTFTAPSGIGLGAGVRQSVGGLGELRAAAGVGRLQGLLTPAVGSPSPFVEADASVTLLRHLAVVAGIRRSWWTRAGERYWFAPTTFGVRVM